MAESYAVTLHIWGGASTTLPCVFGGGKEKKERDERAQAELDRLLALAPDELAVEVLPALASEKLYHRVGAVSVQDIRKQVMADFPSSFKVNSGPLLIPVREALQRLEHDNLVLQMASSNVDASTRWRITPAGKEAVEAGDVAARLSAGT
jgi:hypothetical protein